jgi:cytochrome c5
VVRRTILTWMGITSAVAAQSSSPAPSAAAPFRAVLDRYCVTCHNEKLKTADLLLDKADLGRIADAAPLWEKVARKLRTGAMPPAGMPRPDQATYESFATYIESPLDRAAAAKPNPGRPTIHRLNRAEYTNAIRDLLAVDTDGESLLPADDSAYGFDNVGEVLSISPSLFERYMAAARKVSRIAIGDPAVRPVSKTYDLPQFLTQEDRASEDLPFGTRGGIAIRHNFPAEGEYVLRIRLQRSYNASGEPNRIVGLAEAQQLEVRLDGTRIKEFTVGGERNTRAQQVAYERTADAGLEVRFSAKAGERRIGVAFLSETSVPEGALRPQLAGLNFLTRGGVGDGGALVGSVTITGPYDTKGVGDTASRRQIFSCRPNGSQDEESCAHQILSTLARRAYRRPVTEEDVRPLMNLYRAGYSKGGFEAGIGTALRGILVSLPFLFRVELDPANVAPNAVYRISDLELASRLSFFLWSSLPDDELVDLGARGRLKDRAVLEQQVQRMLADRRSKALVSNFVGQWLYVRNMRSVLPNPEAFPDFDENLRNAFEQETNLFFENMLREDRSVLDLLNANYTFLNERLARHYGIPNVYGSHFRRVILADEDRKGLLGQGSVLTVTSYPNRTSPTIRGKWVLENILGTPPPSPPPNAPSLKDTAETQDLTMRQRMEQHRANPACASCHAQMDPLGFALENFDAIGKWRIATETNTTIDASGTLPDGSKFKGPGEFQRLLLQHPQQLVTTVTEKLLTYALGRGVEYYDAPAVRKITRDAASSEYRWSSLIMGIVTSTPFQMRNSRDQ